MDDHYIVTVYTIIDDVLKACGAKEGCRAADSTAEILTVGGIAVKYFQNHHERAVCVMTQLGYIGKDVGKRFAGTVPPKRRNSLAGGCT